MAALDGKTVLITGATSGIGFEASIDLAKQGARLVMVGRDPAKTEAKAAEVRDRSGSATVETLLADVSSQAPVRKLAADFRAKHDRLDVLINNAGTVFASRTLTEDGIEATFATNHLSAYLLTRLLQDLVVTSAPARIVVVASVGHYRGTMDFDDLGFERGYQILRAYFRSKLGNVMFARELSRRLEGTGATVNAVHPGDVASNIWSYSPWWARPAIELVKRVYMVSPAEGARPLVYLASDPQVEGLSGLYFDRLRPKEPSRLARDDAVVRRLWDESARLTGMDA